jgi:beta-phosphoglucomutase
MTNPTQTISAVVFDMDGVLLDSEPWILKAGQRMLKERYDLDIPDEAFTPYVGRGEDAYLGGPARELGVELKLPDDKIYTYELYLKAIKGHLKALDGVTEFVEKISRSGRPMAIFSAADRMKVEGNLEEIGLNPSLFKIILTGSEVEKKKPDPEGYIRAVKELGLPAQNTLVIEDAVSGIKAGRAAGCPCLGITSTLSTSDLLDAGAQWTAPHLGSLPESFLNLLD